MVPPCQVQFLDKTRKVHGSTGKHHNQFCSSNVKKNHERERIPGKGLKLPDCGEAGIISVTRKCRARHRLTSDAGRRRE
jgi:hypothetical protein